MPITLAHGSFFGQFEYQREVPGFSLCAMTPVLPADQVRVHTHETAHFVLVLGGLYTSQARNAPDVAEAPFLVYNPPGTTHRDRFHSLGGRFLTISVTPERLQNVADCIPLLQESTVLRENRARIMAQRLAGELIRWQSVSALIAEGLSLELLAEVATRAEHGEQTPPLWLKQARDLLREQCSDHLGIAEVAAAVNVHPIHLTRSFRRFFRCTPGEYLRNCRLEKAAALLIHSCTPISEISLEAGFADQSHFSKTFARNFGCSPLEYRRQFGIRVV